MFRVTGFIFVILLIQLFAYAPVQAQEHLSYCESIESTADMLTCVNRHREDAQTRLNMVFRDLLKALAGEAPKERLHESQNNWLSYRNEQCAFEKGQATKPAFERIYEISCITRMTEQRAEQLSMSLFNSGRENPREFGTFPRWMNVLAHENPDIFWRYGQRESGDIDCDGMEEQIVSGVKITPADIETVVAIAENPAAGKPQTVLLSLPKSELVENKSEMDSFVCSPYVDFVFKAGGEDGEEEEIKETCQAHLLLNRAKCKKMRIHWTGKMYDITEYVQTE